MERDVPVSQSSLVLALSEALDLACPELTLHQQRTAFAAWSLGKAAGLARGRLETLAAAALLHDIRGLRTIAAWAANHHERLDGSGYPFRRTADEMDTGSRIMMVADIFTALAEDRPYRPGMPPKEIERILGEQADAGRLSHTIVRLVRDDGGDLRAAVVARQAEAREAYERECVMPMA